MSIEASHPVRLWLSRKGAIAPMFALMITALVGAMAFSVDFARWTITRNQMRVATDAAALAAVRDLGTNIVPTPSTTPQARALSIIASNLPTNYGSVTKSNDVTIGTYSLANGFVAGGTAKSNAVRISATRSPERGNKLQSALGFSVRIHSQNITVAASATADRKTVGHLS